MQTLGRWLFKYRSFVPIPIALALVFVRWRATSSPWALIAGPALVALGQGLRIWAVRHIGTISRTRSTRLGPLVTGGPYALIRNPLYAGNLFLWSGFAVWSGLLWTIPLVWLIFIIEYGAIERWEASSLQGQFSAAYEEYIRTVPKWLPRWGRLGEAVRSRGTHPWREVFFSERGTLLAAAIMSALMVWKHLRV